MKGKDNKTVPVYTMDTDPDLIQVRKNMEFQERVDSADTPEKFAALQAELSGGMMEPSSEEPSMRPRKSSFAKSSKASAFKMIAVDPEVRERFTLAKLAYIAQGGRSVGASAFLSKVLDAAMPALFDDPDETMRLMRKLRRAKR